MAAETLNNVGLVQGWETGEFFWGGPMNENLAKLDALVHLVIQSTSFNAPPGEVLDGFVFAVGPEPTGPWVGQAGNLAVLQRGAWLFVEPKTGWRARVVSTGSFLWYNGTAWVSEATGADPNDPPPPASGPSGFELAITATEDLTDNGLLLHLPVTSAMFFAANMAGSSLDIINPVSVDAVLRVFRNNVQIGTVTLLAGQFNATFATAGAVVFNVGDRLTVRGPTTAVPDFRDYGVVFRLNLTGGV